MPCTFINDEALKHVLSSLIFLGELSKFPNVRIKAIYSTFEAPVDNYNVLHQRPFDDSSCSCNKYCDTIFEA